MLHFSGIDTDMAAFGKAVRAANAKAAPKPKTPLRERVADAMREIVAIRGSCDMDDLTLRFPAEELTPDVVSAARRLAGKHSVAKVA
jgi:hypothetical protein